MIASKNNHKVYWNHLCWVFFHAATSTVNAKVFKHKNKTDTRAADSFRTKYHWQTEEEEGKHWIEIIPVVYLNKVKRSSNCTDKKKTLMFHRHLGAKSTNNNMIHRFTSASEFTQNKGTKTGCVSNCAVKIRFNKDFCCSVTAETVWEVGADNSVL